MKKAIFKKSVCVLASFALVSTMFVAAPVAQASSNNANSKTTQQQNETDVQEIENLSSAEDEQAVDNSSDAAASADTKASEQEANAAQNSSNTDGASQKQESSESTEENIDIYSKTLPKGIKLKSTKNETNITLGSTDSETNAKYLYDIAKKIADGDTTVAAANITLNASPNMKGLDADQTWIPIGTRDNPYTGVFDGNGETISNLTVEGTSFLGLFGCIGVGGKVENLTLTGATITAKSSTEVIKCVGVLAGYSYGLAGTGEAATEFSIDNVKVVNSSIKVISTMPVADAEMETVEDPLAANTAGKSDDGKVVEYVGGIVGYCAGNMKNCTLTADSEETSSIYVEARQAPKAGYKTIGKSVGGIVGQLGGYVIVHKETDSDGETYLALEPQYPSGSGKYSRTASTCSITSCKTQDATIEVIADGKGEKDRFGEETTSYFDSVGGICGYSMANISKCENTATVKAEQGDGVGGICGNLRALVYSGSSPARSDAGSYQAQGEQRLGTEHALTIYRCTNDAAITGLHAVGGIEGGGGTYTAIKECANLSKDTEKQVLGMRWNKPMAGGIAGQTYGDILQCYSTSVVTSKTGAGFYVAGVVGATARFTQNFGDEFDSPSPEVASCYSSGAILSGSAYKEGGVCGSNEGYIHDCYYLSKTAQNDLAVAESDYGTVNENTVMDLSSADLVASAALLNACLKTSDYTKENAAYYMRATDAATASTYPVLNWMSSASTTDISSATITQSDDGQATYTTSQNPVPKLALTLNGTQLTQNVDYYVLPDSNALDANGKCKDVYGASSIADTTFKAKIVGIGAYSGTNNTEFDYKIGKGDFAECTVVVQNKKYNTQALWPSEDVDASGEGDLVVKDGTGDIIDRSNYAFPEQFVNFKRTDTTETKTYTDKSEAINYKVTDKQYSYDKKAHTGYQLEIVANENSNYTGTTYGFFVISKADILGDSFYYADAASDTEGKYALLECNGKKYYFEPGSVADASAEARLYSLDENGNKVYGLTVPYTGQAYTKDLLTVNGMWLKVPNATDPSGYYKLVQGKDFKVVYGDPQDATDVIETDTQDANTNATEDVAGKRACITIRYVAGNSCNFTNYANLFFTIEKVDISTQCSVDIANNYTYTGKAPTVVVKGSTGATIPSSNYTVSCTSSTYGPGTFNVTVTGKNNLTGSITKTVTANKPTLAKVKKISKIKIKGGKKIKLKWKGVTGASGYQIAYKVKSSKKWKYVTSSSKSKTIKKLKKGKKYNFKVRAYKKVGNKYFYGKYCSKKTSKKVK